MTNPRDEPRIYVACLASYNAGVLHGEWIEAAQALETIREQIQDMLASSPERCAEEYAIHDYDNFGGLQIHEYENLEAIQVAAQLLQDYPEIAAPVMNYYGGLDAVEDAREAIENRYIGHFDDLGSWAQEYLNETGALDGLAEPLRCYFDFCDYGRDLELSGEIIVIEVRHQVHLLWSR